MRGYRSVPRLATLWNATSQRLSHGRAALAARLRRRGNGPVAPVTADEIATVRLALGRPPAGRRRGLSTRLTTLVLVGAMVPIIELATAPAAAAATSSITIDAHDLTSGATLPTFQYIVNV